MNRNSKQELQKDIEWIKIPAGEYRSGISEEQRGQLREQIRRIAGFYSLSANQRTLLNAIMAKFAELGKPVFTDEELEALKNPIVKQVRRYELDLLYIPGQQSIWLDEFEIARYPITLYQYMEWPDAPLKREGLEKEPRNFLATPVMAAYPDATAYCEWIEAHLPTARQWEKTARGTLGRLFPWGDQWDIKRGNFGTGRAQSTGTNEKLGPGLLTAVDRYSNGVSPYGVWDMAGNIGEWTRTPYTDDERVRARLHAIDPEMDWSTYVVTKSQYLKNVDEDGLEFLEYMPAVNHHESITKQVSYTWRGAAIRPVRL